MLVERLIRRLVLTNLLLLLLPVVLVRVLIMATVMLVMCPAVPAVLLAVVVNTTLPPDLVGPLRSPLLIRLPLMIVLRRSPLFGLLVRAAAAVSPRRVRCILIVRVPNVLVVRPLILRVVLALGVVVRTR